MRWALEVDPNLVRPGWTPLVVVLLLGVVLFFLGRSMMKQFRKIDVPADHDPAAAGAAATETPLTRPVARERTVNRRAGGPSMPDLKADPTDGSGGATPPDRH